jgi:hypothetical protein
VLFAMLAAEAFANQYLQGHLSGEEFKAADKLPTLDKFILGQRLVRGESLMDRGREPAQTLKRLLDQRSALVHPKLATEGRDGPVYTPEEAAKFIVAMVDAASWLLANSEPPPEKVDMGIIAVEQERDYFLEYGRKATERLPEIDDGSVDGRGTGPAGQLSRPPPSFAPKACLQPFRWAAGLEPATDG